MALCATTFLLYLNVATLIPKFIEENHPRFNSAWVGVLISSYMVAYFISGLFVGKFSARFGRKRVIFIGVLIQLTFNLGMGLASLIKQDIPYFLLTLLTRMGQGIGDSMIIVTVPAILAVEFPDKQEQYLGYYEMADGVGQALGPVIALAISPLITEFLWKILFFALLIGAVNLVSFMTLPSRLNENSYDNDG